jgi:hypothetical protein
MTSSWMCKNLDRIENELLLYRSCVCGIWIVAHVVWSIRCGLWHMDFGTCHKVYRMWTVANGLRHFIRPTACVGCGACHNV